MEIHFHKYQGTGNDFVILDNRTELYSNLPGKLVKQLCDRRFGIGADGLMLLNNKEGYDFEMIYYNADGRLSSMCGNGGRCMVRFANDMGIHKNVYRFLAVDGVHEAEAEGEIIRLKMNDVTKTERHLHYSLLNTGSPHYIKFAADVRNMDVFKNGSEIRYSDHFKQEGINVNFVENIDDDSIYMRTYERGVEDETLSCGTGVTAAALMSAHNDNGFNHVDVHTNGGQLFVEFTKHSNDHFTDIYLCGPAKFVFSGKINVTEEIEESKLC